MSLPFLSATLSLLGGSRARGGDACSFGGCLRGIASIESSGDFGRDFLLRSLPYFPKAALALFFSLIKGKNDQKKYLAMGVGSFPPHYHEDFPTL